MISIGLNVPWTISPILYFFVLFFIDFLFFAPVSSTKNPYSPIPSGITDGTYFVSNKTNTEVSKLTFCTMFPVNAYNTILIVKNILSYFKGYSMFALVFFVFLFIPLKCTHIS